MTLPAAAGFCHCKTPHGGVRLLIKKYFLALWCDIPKGPAACFGSKQLASSSPLKCFLECLNNKISHRRVSLLFGTVLPCLF